MNPASVPTAVVWNRGSETLELFVAKFHARISPDMPQINPEARDVIQPELGPGEEIMWAGKPATNVIFHKEDLLTIPASLLWGGFAIFWELGVMGFFPFHQSEHQPTRWTFGILWGVPFVLIGQYLIWGRFIYADWLKKRTNYAVTNHRVIVVQKSWKRQITSAYLDNLPALTKEEDSDRYGKLLFADPKSVKARRRGWGGYDRVSVGGFPAFVDIEDATSVYRLILDLQDKSRTTKAAY